MTALLQGHALAAGYGEIGVLDDVSFAVAEGSITALVGSNGAGKSTLMRAIAGLNPLSNGRLVFDGAEIGSLAANRRVGLGLALVPEGRMIFADFTVEENLAIGAIVPRARAQAAATMAQMFELFPVLGQRRGQPGGTLSGGEQQMLALARGLMSQPRLLLLDEPSLGLAPKIVERLFEAIPGIRDSGVTVFIVEQNVGETLAIADTAYVLENGRIVRQGSGLQLLDDPAVKEAYLGL